jgi:hypothetical protein
VAGVPRRLVRVVSAAILPYKLLRVGRLTGPAV